MYCGVLTGTSSVSVTVIKMVTGSVVHWFRKGLRLHDNPALLAAVERAAKDGLLVRPVYILDPWFVKNARVGPNRFGIP